MMFGKLQLAPPREVGCHGEIRNHLVVSAAKAQCCFRVSRDQPVAGVMPGVRAKPIFAVRRVAWTPYVTVGVQRVKRVRGRMIAEAATACLATTIFKVHHARATGTKEELHSIEVPWRDD